MTALARAGWILVAGFFAFVLSSIVHVDHAGAGALAVLAALAAVCVIHATAGIELLAILLPLAWFLMSRLWNSIVPWAEAFTCAGIAALAVDATRTPARRVPFPVAVPAMLFAVIVTGSMFAGLAVLWLRLGPAFADALTKQIFRQYFVDVRGFPALHTGLLLLEGIALFALASRLAAGRPQMLRRIAAATATGAAVAGAINIGSLLNSAWQAASFWAALVTLARTVRWNAHYPDFNAAGSYFAMTTLVAAGLALPFSKSHRRRVSVTAVAVMVLAGAALWLTGSRTAYVAVVLGVTGAVAWASLARHRAFAPVALTLGALVLVAVIVFIAPKRGNQHSSFVAADVRLGMAETAGRMIATRPAFGIGLGQFYQRSGEFSAPELFEKFPVAMHENAHNNFLQIAAELGLTGGVVFVWLVAASLIAVARRAPRDPFHLLTLSAVVAFVLTWLAGHPLLVPEAGYAFWVLLGTAVGATWTAPEAAAAPARRWIAVAIGAALICSVPLQMRIAKNDADLEHVGIGLSAWQTSPDGIRYRAGSGHATLFVPTGAFKVSVNPQTDRPTRVELRLNGRVADVVPLVPHRWNDLTVPSSTERTSARYARFELRLLGDDQMTMWITKVQPLK